MSPNRTDIIAKHTSKMTNGIYCILVWSHLCNIFLVFELPTYLIRVFTHEGNE